MKKTALIVMAAGMGSRFGGPKQITPVGFSGEKIIDYSVYDAKSAGFSEVIFVLNEKIKDDFITAVGNRISKHIPVKYVIQDINDIPKGFSVPSGRAKPWGTGHAMLSCRKVIDCPFMVINADDFYGRECFKVLNGFLQNIDENDETLQFAMAGYKLGNTVTDKGSFSRGICKVGNSGFLESITEYTHIIAKDGEIKYTLDGEKFMPLDFDTVTSLNCWAFDSRIMQSAQTKFREFFEKGFENPIKTEFFLPTVVNELIEDKKATAKVLSTNDKWYGMTYTEDKSDVENAIREMVNKGIYPKKLWD